jgi:hypothetical protein
MISHSTNAAMVRSAMIAPILPKFRGMGSLVGTLLIEVATLAKSGAPINPATRMSNHCAAGN